MSKFAEDEKRNQRLVILRSLDQSPDATLNETLIMRQLEHFGHGYLTPEDLREQLAWLTERNAITTRLAGETVIIAKLTRRGLNHVQRKGEPIEGVDQPSRL